MTTNEIMQTVARAMREAGATADEISKMEICIQYLGNPDFRKALNDYVFRATYKK